MITVALTGGIGSGKTTVAKAFASLGIPIYIADDEAKALMNRSKIIKRKLIKLFGEEAYIEGKLNRPFLANAIFNDKSMLEQMNAIVHPKVGSHFNKWKAKQKSPYVIKEAAIIFENGSFKNYDYIIAVVAPKSLRIERVLNRDNTTKEKILAIMKNQWDDREKIRHSHFVIQNKTLKSTQSQVQEIHNKLLSLISEN